MKSSKMNRFVILICFISGVCSSLSEFADLERPTFPESFTAHVEGFFRNQNRNQNTEIDATIYYDRINNKAAIEILYQGEITREIYKYDEDQVLTIQGTTCSIDEVDNESSFFPYTVDKATGKKILASAEESLYFTKSKYYTEDSQADVPMTIYRGKVDVPRYKRKDCTVIHRFSKPEVTMAQCDGFRVCKPTLISISVQCGEGEDAVDHKYNFYRFQNFMEEESAFQVPPGTYCPGNKGPTFPVMPKFFCCDYDLTEEYLDNSTVQDTEISYKSLCYDSEIELIRVNNYDANGLASTQIYDLINDVGIAFTPTLMQCELGPITNDLTVAGATMLPEQIFATNFSDSKKPAFVGMRKSHGFSLKVWSTYDENDGIKQFTDIYFTKFTESSMGDSLLQLSYIEEYFYEKDTEKNEIKLAKITYIPMRRFQLSRNWSVFNMSSCFPEKFKRSFEIKLTAECSPKCSEDFDLQTLTTLYSQIQENLYYALIESANITVMRLSGLQISATSEKGLTYSGLILEDPALLMNNIIPKDDKQLTMAAAFNALQKDVEIGGINFTIYNDQQALRFTANSFGKPKVEVDDAFDGYSRGAMAGLAVSMILIGAIIGAISIFVAVKSKIKRTDDTTTLVKSSDNTDG